jgi:uncharacterized protein YndB with AHSA1/START domain
MMAMAPIVSTVEVAVPPDEAFAYITDVERFPEWQRDVVRVRVEGDRFTTTRRIGRTERSMTQEIVASHPPRTWSARGVDGPIRPNAVLSIEPAGSGSRITLALDYEGVGLGRALLPLVRRQTQAGAPVSLANLKKVLEATVDR